MEKINSIPDFISFFLHKNKYDDSHTVIENIIGAPEMREKLWCFQIVIVQYCNSNIGHFSRALCKVISLNLFV